eukprot:CAMPEP_0183336158 /NCGR_PEP_ID=MMETSP0164_2-20130417/4226_1 /TAXON_ID=221442 /ORGANISM="Coccolithus pelagicus ssp braarudi, Strain PLY182g" /LENGTH=149 /DNA_ID=CAMNT_0025505631 /DNA_START=78 /DNA_END=527 /DNA_ORIENTATION=+
MTKKKNAPKRPAAVEGGDTAARVESTTNAHAQAGKWARTLLSLFFFYMLGHGVLPFLADLTPPGVDLKAMAEPRARRAPTHKSPNTHIPKECKTSCDGLHCPDGWLVDRSPDDACKCICSRADPAKLTRWDQQQKSNAEGPPRKQEAPS